MSSAALSRCSSCESYCSFWPRRTSGRAVPTRQHENARHPVNRVAIWCAQCAGHGASSPKGCAGGTWSPPHVQGDIVSTSSPALEWRLIWGTLRLCTRSCSPAGTYWELAHVPTLHTTTSTCPAWTPCPPRCRPESTFEHSAIW